MISCGPQPVVDNAIPSTSSTLYMTTVVYTCEDGYATDINISTECGAPGQWGVILGSCAGKNH